VENGIGRELLELNAINESSTQRNSWDGIDRPRNMKAMNITCQPGSGHGVTSLSGSPTFSSLSDNNPAFVSVLTSLMEHMDFSEVTTFFFGATTPEEKPMPFDFHHGCELGAFPRSKRAPKFLGLWAKNGDVH
jgi:hypothetical protein